MQNSPSWIRRLKSSTAAVSSGKTLLTRSKAMPDTTRAQWSPVARKAGYSARARGAPSLRRARRKRMHRARQALIEASPQFVRDLIDPSRPLGSRWCTSSRVGLDESAQTTFGNRSGGAIALATLTGMTARRQLLVGSSV